MNVIILKDYRPEDGVMGYIPGEAKGAIPNGTKIVKTKFGLGDTHKVGDKGTVISSVGPAKLAGEIIYFYFVEWEDMPGLRVGIASTKIAAWTKDLGL